MGSQQEIEALQARVAELEDQNRELQTDAAAGSEPGRRKGGRARSILAAVLVVVSIIVAPVAVLGTWARLQLVDTDRFVQTFAPLSEEPSVQAFITDQVVDGIDENIDIDALVGDLFTGLSDLDLPPRAAAALPLLEGPAAEGMRSLITTAVERIIASQQFSQLWEAALRETHSRAIAIIQGDPNTALQLSDDGTLSIQLDVVIREVKQTLVAQGLGVADQIPEIDRAIPIIASDSFTLIRTVYQIAVTAGYWLPWAVLGMLGIGVAVARNRARTLAWAGTGLALSFALLAAGLGIGKMFFVGTVSPAIMPAETATVLFTQLTELISSTILALIVLSVFVAVGAWLAGRGRAATAVRGAADSAFASARSASDRHGLNPRGFGLLVERWRSAIIVGIVVIGILVLFLNRPIALGSVITTLIVVLLALALVELVRRPAVEAPATDDPAATEGEPVAP